MDAIKTLEREAASRDWDQVDLLSFRDAEQIKSALCEAVGRGALPTTTPKEYVADMASALADAFRSINRSSSPSVL